MPLSPTLFKQSNDIWLNVETQGPKDQGCKQLVSPAVGAVGTGCWPCHQRPSHLHCPCRPPWIVGLLWEKGVRSPDDLILAERLGQGRRDAGEADSQLPHPSGLVPTEPTQGLHHLDQPLTKQLTSYNPQIIWGRCLIPRGLGANVGGEKKVGPSLSTSNHTF